ncbi:DUF262 domain-containing protein [Tenacibaculum sp. 1_MG-2023]|uniref:DUF262 domain-containing protein n=1 Tax=Tenacibaculum sp. 1_MG-2023 TaxID=3062653 RepID=UPI0026E21940|nr:DUF262 domain-containing protein [Tenacibaculum sp. 1_MG-2023]MDO6674990.1 DUF262 domain-containing protein [Tenacibaculum sp. 1_MG-2023]
MKAGKYNVKDLFANRYVNQIIIPEVQRDYVWSNLQVDGLLNSILTDYRSFTSSSIKLPEIEDLELAEAFQEFYLSRKYSSNIGFIYAYTDAQSEGKYFLIDGQQRITTIVLLLLAITKKAFSKLEDKFKATYLHKLDYKVRESSHVFLQDFISHELSNKDFTFKESLHYFGNRYESDKTIQSVLNNYNRILEILECQEVSFEALFDYVETKVEFWYFDTNISEQGEELYIYMNARGEHMQANENIKAVLLEKLPDIEEKNRYGKKWEEWQDFFWVKRDKNQNADKGFNQFLSCIAGLELYLKDDRTKFYNKSRFDENGIKISDILEVLDISCIEKYFNVLKELFEKKEQFIKQRDYCKWLPIALDKFWELLNTNTINWFADYTDNNRAVERNAMVYIWSVLLYLTKSKTSIELISDTYRLLRIYWVRYNNNIRSVSNIKIEVNSQINSGIWKEPIMDTEEKSTVDEHFKNKIYNTCKPSEQKELEELIWEIEDHEYNLLGRDVGNINITHLIDKSSEITIESLTLIRDKFYELFPVGDKNHNTIKHVLLYYGAFYDRVSPYYYRNYNFSNWRRIIRNLGNEKKDTTYPFKDFWNDFLRFKGTINKFIEKKGTSELKPEDCLSFNDKLLWYSTKLKEKMWSQGTNICLSLGNPCSLSDWSSKDEIFSNNYIFYNTKGNLKGGTPKKLSNLL